MQALQDLTQAKLEVLRRISQVIEKALDLDKALEDILAILSGSLSMKRGTVTLKEEDTGLLSIRASYGLSPEEKKKGIYRLDEGVTGRIFSTVQPFVVPDISQDPLFLDKTGARGMDKEGISFLGVPIILQNKAIGVLTVDRLFEENVSSGEDIQFLGIVAAMVAQFVSLNWQVQAREEDLRQENLSLKTKLSGSFQRFMVLGKSDTMQRVHQVMERVAPTQATILLLGESGTGKTMISKIIHELSNRSKYPFVKISCSSLPENLLESELFGYETGAFSGADHTKPGRFEEAHQGTIFLDEIGEMSLAVQTKLLRFLQEREFERLGGNRTKWVDVRIIAATNKDLHHEVQMDRFRRDLFYRLNVFPIRIPALRERFQDIPALLNHFLDKVAREYGRRLKLTGSCLEYLSQYSWPGNIREMENLVEQLSIMAEGEKIDLWDLPFYMREKEEQNPKDSSRNSLAEMERNALLEALQRNFGVQSRAALELGLTQRQIGYRVKKFGLRQYVRDKRKGM